MKIGIEVQRLFRKKKFGIETSSLELIQALRRTEPKHDYVIFAKDDEDRKCLTASANLQIKTLGGKLFADFEQFVLPLAAQHEKVDLLHCTGNTAPYFSPVPVIQTLHDVIFMDAIPSDDSFYQRFGNYYRRKIVPLVTPRSHAVITVSQYEKGRIAERLGIDPEKIHVVYNGINEKRFHAQYDLSQRQYIQEKYQLPADFILFLGNQSVRKNPEGVIEAYVRYAAETENPFALVTPGLSKRFIVNKLHDLQYPYNSNQFLTPGYIEDADLPIMLVLSKIFLFPSFSEGFGMPIIEAMACGSPVITSHVSSMPEIAGDAAILTNPRKVDEIAGSIAALAKNRALRTEKIEAGFANAKRFSWDYAATTVLEIYEMVYEHVRNMQKEPGMLYRHVSSPRHSKALYK